MFTFKQKIKPLKKFFEEDQKFVIYKHTCIINGKCYIGKTSGVMESRWHDHVLDSKKDEPKYKFQRAIKKYGEENFTHEILEELNTELFTNAAEKYWIKKLNSLSPHGYNLTDGGEGGRQSEETILKISDSQKVIQNRPEVKQRKSIHQKVIQNRPEIRRRKSDGQKIAWSCSEVRQRHSVASRGKKQSEEHIAKRVESRKRNSVNQSEEHKRNISESKKGNKNPMYGKKQSEEHIAKRVEARRRNKELKKLSNV